MLWNNAGSCVVPVCLYDHNNWRAIKERRAFSVSSECSHYHYNNDNMQLFWKQKALLALRWSSLFGPSSVFSPAFCPSSGSNLVVPNHKSIGELLLQRKHKRWNVPPKNSIFTQVDEHNKERRCRRRQTSQPHRSNGRGSLLEIGNKQLCWNVCVSVFCCGCSCEHAKVSYTFDIMWIHFALSAYQPILWSFTPHTDTHLHRCVISILQSLRDSGGVASLQAFLTPLGSPV